MYNKLKDGYKTALYYVVYNGPPNTIYNEYHGNVHTEEGLINAIKVCDRLYCYIINPSEKVTIAQIKYHGIYDILKEQKITKNIASAIIHYDHEKFNDYANLFTDLEVIAMTKFNPQLVRYVKNQTFKMCNEAIDTMYGRSRTKLYTELFHGGAGVWHFNIDCTFAAAFNQEFLTDTEMIELYSKIYELENGSINYMIPKYITYEMLEKYIKHYPTFLSEYMKKYHEHTLTDDQIKLLYEKSIDISIYNIQHVDPKYQTSEMIKKIIDSPYGIQLYKYLNNIDESLYIIEFEKNLNNIEFVPESYLTFNMCDRAVKCNPNNIKYVPPKFQTLEMCKASCSKNVQLLSNCEYIDREMLMEVHKQNINVPRKDRFKFLNSYKENKICQILKIMPNLLRFIEQDKVTDTIIKTALETDGYTLQYIKNKTEEYINMALKNQPKAVMYI
jgi:hypothetical protein